MIEDRNSFICLELADKSFYDLFLEGEEGDKSIVITPAREGQKKSQISLFDCSGSSRVLLREILLENSGDMRLDFSYSHDFLSYSVKSEQNQNVTEGLIDLGKDELEVPIKNIKVPLPTYEGEDAPSVSRERGREPKGAQIVLSVLLSLSLILWCGFILAKKSSQTTNPPLTNITQVTG